MGVKFQLWKVGSSRSFLGDIISITNRARVCITPFIKRIDLRLDVFAIMHFKMILHL